MFSDLTDEGSRTHGGEIKKMLYRIWIFFGEWWTCHIWSNHREAEIHAG